VGWAGWVELKLKLGNYCCQSCICTIKGGKPVVQQFYTSVLEDVSSVQLASWQRCCKHQLTVGFTKL